jgi:RNA-directed DNA polymerase
MLHKIKDRNWSDEIIKYISYTKSRRHRKECDFAKFDGILSVAKLCRYGYPVIVDFNHFAYLVERYTLYRGIRSNPEPDSLHVSPIRLYHISNFQTSAYRRFTIPKRGGGSRAILAPNEILKTVQRFILESILSEESRRYLPVESLRGDRWDWAHVNGLSEADPGKLPYCVIRKYRPPVSRYAKAYKAGTSIKDAAKYHVNRNVVVCTDIKDFFGAIKYERVFHMFRGFGYNESVATLLANLCTVDGVLPQGASTSPAISNIVCRKMDEQIAAWVKPRKIHYTRYADDLTFSGDFDAGAVISHVRKILEAYGFEMNDKKTRVLRRSQRQQVCGIVCNEKMRLPRKERDLLRQEVYYIRKYGLISHWRRKQTDESADKYIGRLIGQASYALFIDSKDENVREYLTVFRQAEKDLNRELPY